MRLPELAHRPRRAERPSLDTVRPTDLGLGAVAQDAAAWRSEVERTQELETEVKRAEDEKAIEPLVSDLQTRFESRFAQKGAEWDGVEPGFARGALADLDAELAPLLARDDLPPGQRDAMQRRASQYREATGQRAIQYEAQRRGGLAAEQAAARQSTALGAVMGAYTQDFGTRKAARDSAYDGSTPDYTAGVLADHDAVAADLIAKAPEHLKPRVTQQLASQRLTLQGQAMDFEVRGEQAFVAGQAREAGNKMVNGVLTAPSLYETSVANIDQVTAALPRAAQGAARAGLLNDLTEAYVGGLIRDGQAEQAIAHLNSGSLDARLKPDSKARLLAQATQKNEKLDTDDWMARLRLSSQIDDDIASRGATGVGVGVNVGQVAAVLGPREAAEYQLKVEAAERTHASLSGFGQMTPGQIRAHVADMAPQPGEDGFADKQQAYATAARAAEAEIKARETDPAAWALRQAPTLASGMANLGRGDAAAARRDAGAYAVGQLTLQETAGVPPAERRILPKDTAISLVTAATNNADRTAGIASLGQVIEAFAPPAGASGQTITAAMNRQRMVINELKAAGADNGDIAAAVDLGGNPVQLGRYVAASRTGALEALPKTSAKETDQAEIRDAVTGELSAYLRSFAGLPVSAALTNGRLVVAERLAAERLARGGGSVRDAAREAAAVLTDQYKFVGPQGWRMPRAIAERREGPGSAQFGQTLASRGASRIMAGLTARDGEGFYAPAATAPQGMSEAQRRQRYADSVASNGRWMTTPDDAGLALMHPALDGTWTPALDRAGKAVVRTWDQLISEGADRARVGQARPSGSASTPQGIRINNPGNLRPTTDRWQGMVGVHNGANGRFVQFATPEHGLRALSRDIGTKMARGQTSVRSILTQYAPAKENNTEAYIAAVSRAMGVSPTAALDPSSLEHRAALMGAIVQHENGQNPYGGALIAEAARQGMRRSAGR